MPSSKRCPVAIECNPRIGRKRSLIGRWEAVERSGTLEHLRAILGMYRRQPLVARGGQRGGQGIELVVLAGVAAREHAHPRRKLRRHVRHGLAGRRQPHRQVTTEAAGVLYGPTPLEEPFCPALESPQAVAVLREASTLEELAFGFV